MKPKRDLYKFPLSKSSIHLTAKFQTLQATTIRSVMDYGIRKQSIKSIIVQANQPKEIQKIAKEVHQIQKQMTTTKMKYAIQRTVKMMIVQ